MVLSPHSVAIAPPVLGWLMGALIPTEPDHLCSLMALSAGTSEPWVAFLTGVKWGIGHSVGMMLFCAIFLPLQSLIQIDIWEYWGNYFAGSLLIGIGAYFILNTSKYLEERGDGDWVPKQDACSCCGPPAFDIHSHIHNHNHGHIHGSDGSHGSHGGHGGHGNGHGCCEPDPEAEHAPLLPKDEEINSEGTKSPLRKWYDLRGVLIGLLQGLCCPSCIAGLAFVGQMGVQHPNLVDVTVFFAVCFVSILLSSGLISFGLVFLGRGANSVFAISTRTLYMGACSVSMVLGITWIVLNAVGRLEVIDYSSGMEDRVKSLAGPPIHGGSGQLSLITIGHR